MGYELNITLYNYILFIFLKKLKHPGQMLGLISISPLPSHISWTEWTQNKLLLYGFHYFGMNKMVEEQIMQRILSQVSFSSLFIIFCAIYIHFRIVYF